MAASRSRRRWSVIRMLCVCALVVVCSAVQAGPVCEGGKCAVRVTREVVRVPVRAARRVAAVPGKAIRVVRER